MSRLLLAGTGVLAALWALASLTWPIGFDHALYAWTADVVLRGGMPYRDVWDMHGPIVPYLYAIPQLLFGQQPWGIRLLDLLFLGIALVALFRLVRALTSRTTAVWTSLLFLLTYASQSFNETAQPDGWVALLFLVAFAPLLDSPRIRWSHLVLSGAALGVATLVKPLYVVFAVVPLVAVLYTERLAVARLARAAALLLAGFFPPIALCVAWFAARGALADLYEVHLHYTSEVYSPLARLDLAARAKGVLAYFWEAKVVVAAQPAILLGAMVARRRSTRTLGVLLAWAATAVAAVVIQNKFWHYHWEVLLPPLAILAAMGLHAALAPTPGERASAPHPAAATLRWAGAASFIVILLHAAIRPIYFVADAAHHVLASTDRAEYYGHFETVAYNAGTMYAVGRYVRARTTEDDQVAVWGHQPGVLYAAQRTAPFRLAGWMWPVKAGKGHPIREQYRAEYMRDLQRTMPTYFAVDQGFMPGRMSPPVISIYMRDFPELERFLQRHYRYERQFDSWSVYRRVR